MDQKRKDTQRIRILCEFLDKGGGSLEEMIDYINKRLTDLDQELVGKRTVQRLIEKLRNGDFLHRHQHTKVKGHIFDATYKNKRYEWGKGTLKPEFGDLDEQERFTLPFLTGLLNKYQAIPAVQKIIDAIPELFQVTKDEMESANAIFHIGSKLHTNHKGLDEYETHVIEACIQILEHIHKREIIQFGYFKVGKLDKTLEKISIHKVAPLQIRLFEHFYYLTAVDIEAKRIANFRVDQIHKLSVEIYEDDNENPVLFDMKKLLKTYKLETHFLHVLGVWNHYQTDKTYRISITFTDWAASYARKTKFHPTQTIKEIDLKKDSITIELILKLKGEPKKDKKLDELSPELAFLLGRFREFAYVKSLEKFD